MKESLIEEHTRIGNDYGWWEITADDLFASSFVLNHERERVEKPLETGPRPLPIENRTFWVELMLAAFGIECLIKAVWLKQGHQLARDGKYQPMMAKEGHRLEKLCRAAGISLSSNEEKTLTRLSDIAASAARYPIPNRVSQRDMMIGWSDPHDYDVTENFIARLKSELQKD
jgi:hypothetical protein